MVGFKNRYMVMEVFLNPNRDQVAVAPIILTRSNVTAAIKDSILLNFGECGLGSALGAFQVKYVNSDTNLCVIRTSREDHQKVWCAITMITNIASYPVIFNMLDLSGSIKACKTAALKCEESKFEQFKLLLGDRLSPDDTKRMNKNIENIKILEH
ncbi:hypothetical protein RIF29_17051 [Crotalaria pallida]|uniref:Ribonuclease P/MRP protein subunit POP5 n=1 Tax=Crotalaria pallida TaxID=3830 RepID=A0AAN9FGL8_CROPI